MNSSHAQEKSITGATHGKSWPGLLRVKSPERQPLVPMTISFLVLPRELRDLIYRHLLSTKYTKRVVRGPWIDSLRDAHDYKFFPSILRTSRQIEREASHVLYAENNLIRVSLCGLFSPQDYFGSRRYRNGYAVPILARYHYADSFTRHIMEIVMLREHAQPQPERGPFDAVDRNFIIAGNDLQRFCHTLRVMNRYERYHLDQLTLVITVYTERAAAVVVPFESGRTSINVEGLMRGSFSIKDSQSIKRDALTKKEKENPGNVNIPSAEVAVWGDHAICLGNKTNSIGTNPRVLRLLAPLHRLHSLHGIYIEGSISDKYRTALLSSMLGPPPRDQAMFDVLFDQFEDAMRCYETDEPDAALAKLKLTQDTLKDQKYVGRNQDRDGSILLSTGPYAGHSVWDAEIDIEVQVWTKFAWVFLGIGDEPYISRAKINVSMILGRLYRPISFWSDPQLWHKLAMTFYLKAHVDEAIGKIGHAHRADHILDAVRDLKEGLQYEPGNPRLERKLQECKDELYKYEEMEMVTLDLMEMSERLDETEDELNKYEEMEKATLDLMGMCERLKEADRYAPLP